MNAIDLLRKITGAAVPAETASVESLTRLLEIGEREAGEVSVAIEEFSARRARLLVSGTDAEVDKVDGEIATARRAADRIQARLGEVRRCLGVAQEREAKEKIDAIYARGVAHADAWRVVLGEYEAAAARLGEMVWEMQHHHQQINATNAELVAARDPRRVRDPSPSLLTEPRSYTGPLYQRVELPSATHSGRAHYPADRHDAPMSLAAERVAKKMAKAPAKRGAAGE